MLTVQVFDQAANPAGTVELDESVFGVEVREHLLYDVVRMQLANRRSANPTTKTRSLVSGGGRKPYRQKGTGQARQGSTRAPHYRGGGVVFGPNGRQYTIRLPKKVRREALRVAMSLRVQQSRMIVLRGLALDEFKTRRFAEILKAFGLGTALFVIPEHNTFVENSARNLPGVKVLVTDGLNVYDILRHERLIVTLPAIEKIRERLQ